MLKTVGYTLMLSRHNQIVLLIVTLLSIAPSLYCMSVGKSETLPTPESCVQIVASTSDDYVYSSRTIPPIVVNDTTTRFQALVNILRFQPSPAGIILQIDLRGHGLSVKTEELRYSFRITNDGGVIFYYPFMNSTAAVTKRDGWAQGRWCRLTTAVSKGSAKFYIDDTLVAENDVEHPPNPTGYMLSSIGLGKSDKQRLRVEALAAAISLSDNNSVRFSEDFRDDLKGYDTQRSPNALIQIINPSRYASIEASATPKTASAGESVRLHADLVNSSLRGIGNRSVFFEYQSENKWIELAEVQTYDNGTAKSTWRIPSQVQNPLFIRAHFRGDSRFSEAVSDPFTVVLLSQAPSQPEIGGIVLPLYGFALVAAIFLAFRFGNRVLQPLTGTLCSFILLFSLPMLTNAIEIRSYMAYTPKIVQIQFFGPQTDELIWIVSSLTVAAAWVALQNKAIVRRRLALLPALLVISSVVFHFLNVDLAAAFLGILSAVLTSFYPLLLHEDGVVEAPRGLALGFITSLLTIILVIEIGSAAGWLYNAFDPHVPFDGESRWLIPSLESRLFGILYPVALPSLAVLMFSWLWIPLVKPLVRRLTFRGPIDDQEEIASLALSPTDKSTTSTYKHITVRSSKSSKYLLPLTILGIVSCSLFLVYYPYFYATRLIGVDTPWYYQNLLGMSTSEGFRRIISSYGGASRMPYLLILYVIETLTSLPADFVVKIGPSVPAAFVAVASLLLFKTITHNDSLASFSAYIGLFSIATTVGVFAGTFANWLALGWTELFFTILVLMWRQPSTPRLLLAIFVSAVTLVIHAWTWAVLLSALGAFVMLGVLHRAITKRVLPGSQVLRSSVLIVGVNLVLLLLIFSFFSRGEFIALASEGLGSISLNNLSTFPTIFAFTFQYYVGGFFANPILILLSILGLVSAGNFDNRLSTLLFSILLVTSIPLLVETSFWQWRLLYMVPYQVLAVFGTATVSTKFVGLESRLGKICQILLMLAVVFTSLNYALRCLNYIPS